MNKQVQKPTISKVILQWILTLFTLCLIWGMAGYSINLIQEETSNEEYKWHLKDLNDGNYAECVEFYRIEKYLGEATDKKLEPFEEFTEFYTQYILCIEYQNAKNPEQYQENIRECMEKMERICRESSYSTNIPHYEYLIDSLQVVDAKDL